MRYSYIARPSDSVLGVACLVEGSPGGWYRACTSQSDPTRQLRRLQIRWRRGRRTAYRLRSWISSLFRTGRLVSGGSASRGNQADAGPRHCHSASVLEDVFGCQNHWLAPDLIVKVFWSPSRTRTRQLNTSTPAWRTRILMCSFWLFVMLPRPAAISELYRAMRI